MDVHLLGCRDYFGWLEMDKAFDRTEIESPFVVFEGGVIVELASDESVGFRVGRDLTGSWLTSPLAVLIHKVSFSSGRMRKATLLGIPFLTV